ncbi:OsmC family protein [Chloroflexi bacterium TSY]|nr:OsmC family protein [Chloroflexi bacterium TSY]
MKLLHKRVSVHVGSVAAIMLALLLSACQPIQPVQPLPEAPQLATASVSSQLSNQPGRAIVSARGNHFIVDSVPPLEGPNEELNPLDMMLGSLATCGLFIVERVAQELELPLNGAVARVEGDLDPSVVAGSGSDPRIQILRVHLNIDGANEDQIGMLVENFIARCPIYTTLSRAAEIEITTNDQITSVAKEGLATARVSAQLSNQPGRAIVGARGNHFVIDSVPPLQGPNEERNPLDLMLGALATCGAFIYERAAQEMDLPLTGITTVVEGDFNPRGVASIGVDPRIQSLRIKMQLQGVDKTEAAMLTEQFQSRCPIYTTLNRAAPIEITTETM